MAAEERDFVAELREVPPQGGQLGSVVVTGPPRLLQGRVSRRPAFTVRPTARITLPFFVAARRPSIDRASPARPHGMRALHPVQITLRRRRNGGRRDIKHVQRSIPAHPLHRGRERTIPGAGYCRCSKRHAILNIGVRVAGQHEATTLSLECLDTVKSGVQPPTRGVPR